MCIKAYEELTIESQNAPYNPRSQRDTYSAQITIVFFYVMKVIVLLTNPKSTWAMADSCQFRWNYYPARLSYCTVHLTLGSGY